MNSYDQSTDLTLARDDLAEVEAHLRRQYAGVFDESLIALHVADFIESSLAGRLAAIVAHGARPGDTLLDIGCGYGAFVLACRAHGLNAWGFELAPFEVEIARRRLGRQERDTDPTKVFHQGGAERLPFEDAKFDVVTLLNVLEHVPDQRPVLREALRVLRPGGKLLIICPNYAALRQEAHYHVPWLPLFPRPLATAYLRLLGRNPAFFREHIHYRTNWGVLATLRELHLRISNLDILRLEHPELIGNRHLRRIINQLQKYRLLPLVKLLFAVNLYNPLKYSVSVVAIKGE